MDSILGRVIAAILVLLAIAGVVVLGARALNQHHMDQAVADLGNLASAVHQLGSAAQGYANLSNTQLITAGLVPAEMVAGSSTLQDPWGGAVTVSPDTVLPGGTPLAFDVNYAGLSDEHCINMAMRVEPAAFAVQINGTELVNPNPIGFFRAPPPAFEGGLQHAVWTQGTGQQGRFQQINRVYTGPVVLPWNAANVQSACSSGSDQVNFVFR